MKPGRIEKFLMVFNVIRRRQNQLLPNIINLFKSTTSKFIHRSGLNAFQWQKSFYDHIIRNEHSLFKIRQYIRNNPKNWDEDRNNLINKSSLNSL